MKVKDAMHRGADWVGPDTPITEVAKLMREHDIGAIPIGENDRLIGMVTDRDIVCKGLAKEGFDPGRCKSADCRSSTRTSAWSASSRSATSAIRRPPSSYRNACEASRRIIERCGDLLAISVRDRDR